MLDAPLDPILDRLRACGFDLSTAWGEPPEVRLEGAAPRAQILVANSRALWPRFVDEAARTPDLDRIEDPLDTWVERTVDAIVRAHPGFESVQWAHTRGAGAFSALDAAERAGLAVRGPAHLAVHPDCGPWFAIRALVTFRATAAAPASPVRVCTGCAAPCVAAFERARDGRGVIGSDDVSARWRDWVAVRDACPVGHEARYSDRQIRYHYTRDLQALRDAIAARSARG